jgi:glycosyltransferase involved in cell wall biosynthesis
MMPMSVARPLVTIVLPTLGAQRFLATSIASCLGQSYEDLELIVVDGGSSGATSKLIESLGDRRVRWIRHPDNRDRLPGALNLGFAHARGELFTWTQDDDLLAPEALAVLADGLSRHRDAGMVYAGTAMIDESGSLIREAPAEPPEALAWTNAVGHSFLYRRSVAEAVGPYDPAYLMAEDVHYWLRIYRRFPLVRLDGELCFHRLHPENLTGAGYGAYEALRVAARARRAVLGLGGAICRRQIAAAWVEEAFRAYQKLDYGHVWSSLARAAVRDPRELALIGVASIAARSLARRPKIPRAVSGESSGAR